MVESLPASSAGSKPWAYGDQLLNWQTSGLESLLVHDAGRQMTQLQDSASIASPGTDALLDG